MVIEILHFMCKLHWNWIFCTQVLLDPNLSWFDELTRQIIVCKGHVFPLKKNLNPGGEAKENQNALFSFFPLPHHHPLARQDVWQKSDCRKRRDQPVHEDGASLAPPAATVTVRTSARPKRRAAMMATSKRLMPSRSKSGQPEYKHHRVVSLYPPHPYPFYFVAHAAVAVPELKQTTLFLSTVHRFIINFHLKLGLGCTCHLTTRTMARGGKTNREKKNPCKKPGNNGAL